MKFYISGPMSGKPESNFPLFREAAERLRALGFAVLSPAELDAEHPIDNPTWGRYLGRDIELIADDEVSDILLLPEWHTSRGARLETALGLILGLEFWFYEVGKILRMPRVNVATSLHRSWTK